MADDNRCVECGDTVEDHEWNVCENCREPLHAACATMTRQGETVCTDCWGDGDKEPDGDPLSHAVHMAADRIQGAYGHEDMHSYADAHPAIALEVARHGGTLFDMDCMVDLEQALGAAPTWDLYTFVNDRLDEDVMTFLDADRGVWAGELASMVEAYATPSDAGAVADRCGWRAAWEDGRVVRLTRHGRDGDCLTVDVDGDETVGEAVKRRLTAFDPDLYVIDRIRRGEPVTAGVYGLLNEARELHASLSALDFALRKAGVR